MTYVAIPSFTPRQKLTASQLDQYVKGNIEHLMARPQGIASVTAANITTTSVTPTFVDMDGTNVKVTVTPSRANSILLCWLTGTFGYSITGQIYFRLAYGGGPTFTNQFNLNASTNGTTFTALWTLTGMASASTVLKPQWCIQSAGTATWYGTTAGLFGTFGVLEIG